MNPAIPQVKRILTGIEGLDAVLQGGLIAHDIHLLYGKCRNDR